MSISPFDAAAAVTFDADGVAVANRFGMSSSQRGYCYNKHFPTEQAARSAFEAALVDLRSVYGSPARNWTGRYLEDELTIPEAAISIRAVRFTPILKNGRKGKTVHTVSLYPIRVTPERIEQLAASLRREVL